MGFVGRAAHRVALGGRVSQEARLFNEKMDPRFREDDDASFAGRITSL